MLSILYKFLIIGLLISSLPVQSQDYLVSWNGDTVYCRMIGNPRKEGLRPAWKYKNGYNRIPVMFGDSLRVIEAGEYKSYYRASHGKYLLCDGEFFAFQIPVTLTRAQRESETPEKYYSWHMLRRVFRGNHVDLYMRYYRAGSDMEWSYYVLRKGEGRVYPELVFNHKSLLAYLSGAGFDQQLEDARRRGFNKGIFAIVEKYEELKKAAASQ